MVTSSRKLREIEEDEDEEEEELRPRPRGKRVSSVFSGVDFKGKCMIIQMDY